MNQTGFSTSSPMGGMGHERGQDRNIDIEDTANKVIDRVKWARSEIQTRMKEQPYFGPVAAGTVGFLAGALFGSRIARMMLVLGIGYAINESMRGATQGGGQPSNGT
jgi:hypothetical protein